MTTKQFKVLRAMKFAVMGAAFVALASAAVMLLWNWLIPSIFGLGAITWVQALGLLVLSKILFGGRGWGGGHGWGGKHRHEHWREKMEARMANMTEEQRAEMQARWGRCGHGHGRGHGPRQDAPQSNAAS